MSSRPRKIMIVSYVFPPFAAVGVYRVLKFCKYLVKNGFEPVIYTPENPRIIARDEKLIEQVPENTKIFRTKLNDIFHKKPFEPSSETTSKKITGSGGDSGSGKKMASKIKSMIERHFSVPDRGYFWITTGLNSGIDIIRREKIDIVLSSSPPQSVHVLASRIAARTHRAHIVDFRDLWTQNTSYDEKRLPAYLRYRDRRMEKAVLKKAAGITVNTDTFKRQLLENNGFLSERDVVMVANGVDPDDFREFAGRKRANREFTMLYTGSLYGRHRDPEFFFRAIRKWLEIRPQISEKVKVKFIGNWTAEYFGLIEDYKLERIIEKSDWLPQRQALREVFAADLLLLFQGFDPALEAAVPRKLYEYMITGQPILAFAPPGEIPDLIDRYGCGRSLPDTEPGPIIDFLDKIFSEWESHKGREIDISLRSMPELETESQIKKLVRLCDRIDQQG